MVSFSDAVKDCLTKKYFTISGRSPRAEYWWFQLFIWGIIFTIIMIGATLEKNGGEIFIWMSGLFYLITLIPNFCSRIRRLHDTNHSGWTLLMLCIPYIGAFLGLFILILLCKKSDESSNEYGPNPNEDDHFKIEDEGQSGEQNNKVEIIDVDL